MFVLGRKRILVPFTRSPRVQFVRLRSGLAISTQLVRMSAVNKIHQLRCDWKPKRSRTTWIELSVTKELPRSKNASCRSRTMWRVGERLRTTVMSGSWTKFQAIRCPSKLRAALIVATYLRTDKSKRHAPLGHAPQGGPCLRRKTAVISASLGPPESDMCSAVADVCYGPKADIANVIQSLHRLQPLKLVAS